MSRAKQNQGNAALQPPLPIGGQQPPPPPPSSGVEVDMETGAAGGPSHGSIPGLHGIGQSFQLMQLKQKDLICDHLDSAMLNKKGIIFQYINSNSTGSTTMIGVTRIAITDARKIPSYVTRNVNIIRQHAVIALQRHMQLTQCATGVLETLCPEDYSISFSWASVTEAGRALTQNQKPDLALGYAVCEEYVAPVLASRYDPQPVCVLNVFIQLQEASRRRNTVIRKAKEDEALKANSPPKKYAHPYRPPNQVSNNQLNHVVEMVQEIKSELKRPAPVAFNAQDFPNMVGGQPPQWNKSGINALPDEDDQ